MLSWAYNSLLKFIRRDELIIKLDCDNCVSRKFSENFSDIFDGFCANQVMRTNFDL